VKAPHSISGFRSERQLANNGRAVVLLVDDEEMVITSVRAYLALEADYDLQGFTRPDIP